MYLVKKFSNLPRFTADAAVVVGGAVAKSENRNYCEIFPHVQS